MRARVEDGSLAEARQVLLAARFVCPHTDADGLAAGAIALVARREKASEALLLPRGKTPFQEGAVPDGRPAAILDWGVRPFKGDALFVDHHFPESEPRAAQIVISGYGTVPEVTTAVLMGRIVPEAPRWLVATGAVGDLGDAAWDLLDVEGVPKTSIRKLVPLINAPRRVPDGPVETALELLLESPDAGAALRDSRAGILADAKDAWRDAFSKVLHVPPRVERGIALIRFSSPYQIHPLVAQVWARRLAPNIVVAANDDYLPGMVNFSLRGGEEDLRSLLRRVLPEQGGEFAHGHDRATGGSLPPESFERLLHALRDR